MNRNVSFYTLIFALVILNFLVLYFLQRCRTTIDNQHDIIEQLQEKIKTNQQIIDENYGVELQELINISTQIDIDSFFTTKVSINNPQLVYRFSSASCHSCVDSTLVLIESMPDTLKKNVLILSDNVSTRELHVMLHSASLVSIKYAIVDRLVFPFDSTNIPYFFILDRKRVVRMFFIPSADNKARTLNYLNYVINEYLTDK
jgi:hypothetical protein